MLNEKREATEALQTLVAFILLLDGMNPLMSSKVGATAKGFPTVAAFIRFLSSMDFLVVNER